MAGLGCKSRTCGGDSSERRDGVFEALQKGMSTLVSRGLRYGNGLMEWERCNTVLIVRVIGDGVVSEAGKGKR